MKRILVCLIFGILLVGLLGFSIVLAENDNGNGNRNQECVERDGACCRGENCIQIIVDCVEGLFPEFEGCDEDCGPIWECEKTEDSENGEDDEEELEIEVEIEDGVSKIEVDINGNETKFTLNTTDNDLIISEIASRTGLTQEEINNNIKFEFEDELELEKGEKTKIRFKNKTAETELELEQEIENNKTKLKAKLSNGKKAEIKIMPDAASEKALERLRLKVCSSENNCTIELKEVPVRKENRAAYEVQVERHFKILSLFEAKARVKAQVDAETGEIIIVKKPWWAFLASEPEE